MDLPLEFLIANLGLMLGLGYRRDFWRTVTDFVENLICVASRSVLLPPSSGETLFGPVQLPPIMQKCYAVLPYVFCHLNMKVRPRT